MNQTDNNVVLMALLILIPVYTVFVAVYRHKIPERFYPIIVYLIGLSLLLMLSLRSNHIIGSDIHDMYYVFQLTLKEGHWSLFIRGLLDATLSISLLPTIYQSFLQINPEYLFKILYALLFSISPLVVYIIAKKYIGSFYALLASFFFMAQFVFLWTVSSGNTNLAILFFALAIMGRFYGGMSEFARRFLFIVFAISAILSHYSTSYIFFFVLLLTWIGMDIIPRLLPKEREAAALSENTTAGSNPHDSLPDRAPPISNVRTPESTAIGVPQSQLQKGITITMVLLLFVFFFFWYSQITVSAFDMGVGFINYTLLNLNKWYLVEAKGPTVAAAVGEGIYTLPQQIRVIFSWLTVAFIAIGVLSTMARYKRMVAIPNSGHIKPDFLQSKFELEYFVLGMACSAILVLATVLPYVLAGYSMERTYFQMLAVLSPFFIIGSIIVAKWIKVGPHWVMLLVLVPFFMSTTGVLYQLLGYPASLMLNSTGSEYQAMYVHDEESYAAKWLGTYRQDSTPIYPSGIAGIHTLTSQGNVPAYSPLTKVPFVDKYQKSGGVDGYIFLRTTDTTVSKPVVKYPDLFATKSKIYTAGASEIYR